MELICLTDYKLERFLKVNHVETVTNARLKKYPDKTVLQVANADLFSTGAWERTDGKSKRDYSVPPKGQAADPVRALEESRRRAKAAIRDIALMNNFSYMFTLTLDPEQIDRYNPDKIYPKLKDFLKNAVKRKGFSYVLIPEYHTLKEGETRPAIHFHGLCNLGNVELAPALAPNGDQLKDNSGRLIFNMVNWSFGFSTCVPLDGDYEKAVSYITKYITKQDEKIFGKWYLSSRNIPKKPDIVPLERVDFYKFRDDSKLYDGTQYMHNVYRDIVIINEEFKS